MSFYKGEKNIELNPDGLKDYFLRDVSGFDVHKYRSEQFKDAITNPTAFYDARERHLKEGADKSADLFSQTVREFYDKGYPLEVSKRIATEKAGGLWMAEQRINNMLFPNTLGQAVNQSIFEDNVLGNAGRLQSQKLTQAESTIRKRGPTKKRKTSKRKNKK